MTTNRSHGEMSDEHPNIASRRSFLWTVGSTGAVLGVAGCIEDEEAPGVDDEDDDAVADEDTEEPPEEAPDGELAVTGVWTGGEEEDFRAVMEHVEGELGVEIQYHPRDTETLLTGTLMDYESGVTPADIVVMPSPARVRADGGRGHLEPVGDLWDPESYAPDPDPVMADGEVYAAPFKMDLKPGLWYRLSFFEEHGLSEPESYDEFLNLLDEIQGIEGVDAPLASGNGVGWPLSDVHEAFILRQDGGPELQQGLIAGEESFTDERVIAAFQEIQDTLMAGYWSELREFGVQYEYFWDNRLPLYFMGSWTPAFEAIEDPEDVDFFRLPGTEGMVATVNWFTVPTYGPDVDGARQAVEQFVSPEGQQVWVERGGFVPSSEEVPLEAYELDVMANLVESAAEVTLVPDLDDSVGDPFQSEYWSQLTAFWTEPDRDIEGMAQSLDEVLQEAVEGE